MGSEALRLFGLISMVIDHVGAAYFPDQLWLRIIGRASFPIFAIFVVKGIQKTRSPARYFLRLLFCAAIGQIPFRLLFETPYWNTLFVFSLWVLIQMSWEHLRKKFSLKPVWKYGFWMTAAIVAQILKLEYLYYGIAFLAFMTEFKPKNGLWWCLWTMLHLSLLLTVEFSWIQVFAFFTPFWLSSIRWEKPKGHLGYWFYPLHLALLYGIRHL